MKVPHGGSVELSSRLCALSWLAKAFSVLLLKLRNIQYQVLSTLGSAPLVTGLSQTHTEPSCTHFQGPCDWSVSLGRQMVQDHKHLLPLNSPFQAQSHRGAKSHHFTPWWLRSSKNQVEESPLPSLELRLSWQERPHRSYLLSPCLPHLQDFFCKHFCSPHLLAASSLSLVPPKSDFLWL